MEKTTTKKPKKVEEKVEYFTDELHKEIFCFQDSYKGTKFGGKPVMKSVSFSRTRK